MMDHVTYDLNNYLDKLDIQCSQQNERERKIERIMKDEEFKKDLHDVCKIRIKEDPATAQNIQAFNRVRNNLHQVTVTVMVMVTDHLLDMDIMKLMMSNHFLFTLLIS